MEEVLGYILNNVLKAQTMTDFATLQVAQEYRKHPFLVHFRVPHVSAVEVKIDLKFALRKKESDSVKIGPGDITGLTEAFSSLLTGLPSKQSFSSFLDKDLDFQKEWGKNHEPILEIFTSSVKKDSLFSLKNLVDSTLQLVQNGVLNAFTNSKKGTFSSFVQQFFNPFISASESQDPWKDVRESIFQIFQNVKKDDSSSEQKTGADLLNIIIDAHDLSRLPPEVISSASCTLHLDRKEWVSVPTEDGSSREKLVSS